MGYTIAYLRKGTLWRNIGSDSGLYFWWLLEGIRSRCYCDKGLLLNVPDLQFRVSFKLCSVKEACCT